VQTIVLHRMGLDWHISLIDSLVSNTLLALACICAIIVYRFYQPGVGNRIYRLFFAIGITVLFCSAVKWSLIYLFQDNAEYHSFVENSMPIRFVFSLLTLSFVSVINWLWSVLEEQNIQEVRRNEAEQLVKEAELAKLRQQLQPHFLFNSLNSISALAGSRPDEARKMIQQLSDFLRGTLKKDEQQTVSLKEELDHLKLYLEIEKVRFGHRLNIEMNIEEESLKGQIPPLLLQPIVENAIKFGLYGTIDAITVSIDAKLHQGGLVVEIKNPFEGETQSSGRGTGFGLSSVQRRLFLLYSRNDLLNTEKKENTFITRLKIPQLK
jgi:LytS/YehU family sensor histidine kinase